MVEEIVTDEEILALYDDQMRRNLDVPPSQKVEQTSDLTRVGSSLPGAEFGAVVYSRLTAENANAAIAQEIKLTVESGRPFEWKLYEHDLPSDLADRLARAGLCPGTREALLCLDLQAPTSFRDSPAFTVRRVQAPEELNAVGELDRAIWNEDAADLVTQLGQELMETPELLSIYLAYAEDGAPVAKGWIRFHPKKAFADLWGGGTHPLHRGKGVYTSLVKARVDEARARGVRFLTTDAMPMSRPILQRMGFRTLSWTTPFCHPGY